MALGVRNEWTAVYVCNVGDDPVGDLQRAGYRVSVSKQIVLKLGVGVLQD